MISDEEDGELGEGDDGLDPLSSRNMTNKVILVLRCCISTFGGLSNNAYGYMCLFVCVVYSPFFASVSLPLPIHFHYRLQALN